MNIITGRSQSGKTKYIMEIIKKNVNNHNFNYIYLVPEFLSHDFEKKLAKYTDNQASINGEVLSFRRLPDYITHLTGQKFSNKLKINSNLRILILKKVLKKINNKLKYYFNIYDKDPILLDIMKILDEFINIDLTIKLKTLNEISNNKIQDLLLIYKYFIYEMNKTCYDSKHILTNFLFKLRKTHFDNIYIFFDKFSGFTTQEFNIINFFSKKTDNIFITIDYCEEYKNIFLQGKELLSNLEKICIKNNKNIKIINLKKAMLNANADIKNFEIMLLKKNNIKILDKNNINVHEAYNIFDECEFIASKIKELILNHNIYYDDIVIISNDLQKHKSIFEIIFEKFKIPIYINDDNNIYENSIIKFILSTLKTLIENLNKNSLKQFIHSLVHLEIITVQEIEKSFKYFDTHKIFLALKKLKLFTQNYYQKLSYFFEKLFIFFDEINLKSHVFNLIQKQKKIVIIEHYYKTWNLISENFKQINSIYGKEYVNLKSLYEILEVIFKTSNINYIPPITNCVLCTNIQKFINNKIVFIVGCNNNTILNIQKNDLLNDNDKSDFEKLNINMKSYKILKNNFDLEYEYIYKLLTSVQNKLFISYRNISINENQSLYKSYIIKILKKYVNNINETNYKKLYYYNKLLSYNTIKELYALGCSSSSNIFFKKIKYIIDNNNLNIKINRNKNIYYIKKNTIISKLSNNINISASMLNILTSCKLKFFFKCILNLKTNIVAELFSTADIGNIKHDILKNINKLNIFDDNNYKNLIFSSIKNYFKKNNSDINNEYLNIKAYEIFHELKSIILELKTMYDSMKFETCLCEFEFNIKNALQIDKFNYNFLGKIDRINIYKENNYYIFQTIDYKSKINFNISDILNEYNMQIYFYLISFYKYLNKNNQKNKIMSCGYLYVPLKSYTKQKVKNYLLTNNYYNKFYNEHNLFFDSKKNSNTKKIINQFQMNNLLIYIEQKIKKIIKSIFDKNYKGNPIFINDNENSCIYCEYKCICIYYKEYTRHYNKYDISTFWRTIFNEKKVD